MDILATQVYEDYDSTPTQKISCSSQQSKIVIGMLCIGTETFQIKEGITQIGRHPDCNIILNNPTISKKHAEIEANCQGTESWICDLNSSNKTKLNNTILRPNRCYNLKHGDMLEFGMVRAIFKICHFMENSLIPETPMANLQKTEQTIIPGTPDSSFDNSSTVGNVSIIPATQGKEKQSVFRYPTLPPKTDTSNTQKSSIQNSSINAQDKSQSFDVDEKQNVGGSKISIHDMETQHSSFNFHDETDIDIDDIDTQKICIMRSIKNLTKSVQEQKVDMHDIETQHDINIQDMKTSKKSNTHNLKTGDDRTRDSEKLKATGIEKEENLTNEVRSNVNDTGVQEDKNNESTSNPNNTDKGENQSKNLPSTEKSLQNRLEEIETSEDETSELEMSRNLLGPKELEDFIEDDDLSDEVKSKSPTFIKTSCVNNDGDINSKSIDNENIFEAATQVNKSDEDALRSLSERKYAFQASSVTDDSDDTNNEFVFQRYSRKDSQENEKSSNNRVSDSEDSITDEEGRFTEIAVKMKQAVEFSQLNRSKEIKNSTNSSKDSDDMFDMLTQPVNRKNEDSSPKSNEKPKDNKYESEVDSNSPTQVINKKGIKNNMEVNDELRTKELDDIEPIQVLSTSKSSLGEASCTISIRNNKKSDKEDITEMENNTLNQIINTKKKPLDVSNKEPNCSLDPSVLNVTHSCTQPINDIEKQKSVSSITDTRKNEPNFEVLAKANLDDSIERNLKAMFADIKEEYIEEQLEISTQVLENVLELSECEDKSPMPNDKSNMDSNSSTNKKAVKLPTSNSILTSSSTPKSIISKSASTDSSKPKESNIAKMIPGETDISKNGKGKLNKYSKNINDQASSTSIDTEQFQQTSKALESDDEDILAGLPEVNISGSSLDLESAGYRININHNSTRQTSVKIAPRKKRTLPKSLRRTSSCRNVENTVSYHTVSEPNSSTISESSSNSCTSNFDINKISVCKHYEKRASRQSKGLIKKTKNLCKSKESDSFASIHSQEKARQSPPISSNRRTHNSSKGNTDRSSVFQVEKEVPVEKAPTELAKKNIPNASRFRKRSLSITDAIDSNASKKRKNDVTEDEPVSAKSRKKNTIDGEGNSANVDKKNSSIGINGSNNRRMSNEAGLDKQAIVKVQRISLSTLIGSISSTPTELVEESDNNCKIRQSQHTNVICDIQTSNSRIISSISSNKNNRTTKNVEARRNPNQRITRQTKLVTNDVSSQIGEESQEIEMIMNGALKKQSTDSNIERKEDTDRNISTKTRNTRKRGNTDIYTDVDNTETGSTSSILSESNNEYSEVPTSRNKRKKVSKNISSIISTTVNESTKRTTRNSKQSTKSTRNQQSIVDSSLEESTEMLANQTTLDNNPNKRNNFRNKQQKRTTGKTKSKRQREDFVEEIPTSETNSSIETTSVLTTPNRTRRSMSSSFTTQSPFKIKHKILFTGISSNDYSKLLTKLGASQVEDPTKCTVLVTDKVRRTVKFLCAVALSVPIVSVDWLINSEKIGHFIELENYILKDLAAETKFGFKLEKSLEKAKEHKLLKGYTFVLTPNTAPPPQELKNIIISCGGKVLLRPPPRLWPQQSVIISPKENLTDAKKFLAKAPKTVTIQSTEFILTGILRQELDFNEFRLT